MTPAAWKRWPLLYPAALLSTASLAWTTWSLVDLLGTGWIGVTVAAGADIIWASVILAEARRLHVAGRSWIVPAIGWVALLAVAGLLAWHGISEQSAAMAVAGPFLPLGAKVVWILALADMRDPAALTPEEEQALADIERGLRFEEKRHAAELRRREMDADIVLADVESDFRIEMRRQDKTRELQRRRPFALDAGEQHTVVRADREANDNASEEANGAANVHPQRSEPFARTLTDHAPANTANAANVAGHSTDRADAFGFAAALPEANRSPRKANSAPPRRANTNTPTKANANTNDPREQAAADYRASVANGTPLKGAELGRRYGRTARWGQKLIAELREG